MRRITITSQAVIASFVCIVFLTAILPVEQISVLAQSDGSEHFFKDTFDDDSLNSSVWEKVEVELGKVREIDGHLEVTVSDSGKTWEDFYWSEAGYVTKYPYYANAVHGSTQGFEVSVDVSQLENVAEMNLVITNKKLTNENPVNASRWYLFQKCLDTKYYHENLTRVRSVIDGVSAWDYQNNWLSPTGELKIKVSTGAISFFENGLMVYSEPFALNASEGCYIYIYTSTWGRYAGTDCFDNFSIQPTQAYRDEFSDTNTNGWKTDKGTWLTKNYQIQNSNGTSHIHINTPFAINRHIRADIQTNASSECSITDVPRLMAKEQDGDNYMYALIALDGTVVLGVVFDGVETVYRASSNLNAYQRHSLDVSCVGETVNVWVDGQIYLHESNVFVANLAGYAGLYCVNSTGSFGYVAVLY